MTPAPVATPPHPLALALLDAFTRRTGVERRYLWTDAFAVTGYLALHERTGEPRHLERAASLVAHVHNVLGRYRRDGQLGGWISGLDEAEGALHPTAGGLRIGKSLPERAPGEPYDANLEWDRDGQYYHYLTRWMHALHRMWRVTGDVRFHRWAAELAHAANGAFIDGHRMYWKMSVDLRRPLVPSMGHHDPLDGLITAETLRATTPPGEPELLTSDVARLSALCRGRDWTTQDALGAGGLLADCVRLVQLEQLGRVLDVREGVFRDAARSLDYSALTLDLRADPRHRLAFRELGLALGIRAVARLRSMPPAAWPWDALAVALELHARLADAIIAFWSEPSHREVATWLEHEDINDVMLAVALEPEGYVGA